MEPLLLGSVKGALSKDLSNVRSNVEIGCRVNEALTNHC